MPADFHEELEALRPYLVRYASFTLRRPHAAEDAVQDTLLAALATPGSYGARASLRTWLTGILKHKCIDVLRQERRETPLPAAEAEPAGREFEDLFDERDHWRVHPEDWASPEQALQQKDFLRVLEQCLAHLPRRSAQAFLLREQMERNVDEICRDLDLSPNNCAAVLYRSRMALRLCLQKHWFAS